MVKEQGWTTFFLLRATSPPEESVEGLLAAVGRAEAPFSAIPLPVQQTAGRGTDRSRQMSELMAYRGFSELGPRAAESYGPSLEWKNIVTHAPSAIQEQLANSLPQEIHLASILAVFQNQQK